MGCQLCSSRRYAPSSNDDDTAGRDKGRRSAAELWGPLRELHSLVLLSRFKVGHLERVGCWLREKGAHKGRPNLEGSTPARRYNVCARRP